jgi:hypothetical protein
MTKLRRWISVAALIPLWSCGGGPEQAAVDQFFRAAQANDRTTLAYMSAVGAPFEVDSWKVVEVTSRSKEAYTLPELTEKFAAVEKDRNAAQERRQKYAEENKAALEEIIPKTRKEPDYKFRGKLGAIQEEWTKFLDERAKTEHDYQEVKQALNRESGVASKSVMRQVELGKLEGEIAVTELLLNLKPKDGAAELPFQVTLRKYELTEPGTDRVEPARWVIFNMEGATEEARAAAAAAAKPTRPGAESAPAAETEKAADAQASSGESSSRQQPARELRGQARVQIVAPKTAVAGEEVVSTVRVRNASNDWIVGFTVTEYWYDQQGNVVGSGSRMHRERFMPGEILDVELRTRKGPNFFSNQFEFSHANGDVKATVVEKLASPT